MVTPFDERGKVDEEQAKRLALALLDSGSQGLVVSGTTGESPTLTREEKLRLFAAVKATVRERGAVIAGTGNYCTQETVELTREAEKAGADAVLLVVPYYNKPSPEGLYWHFKTIAENTHLPCIIYNVPSRTVTSITPETVIRLSQIDNIVGIKEASGNLEQVAKILTGVGKEFLVYSGNDTDTFPILTLGGYGVVSVASHLVGRQIGEMIEQFLRGNIAEARRIHLQLLPLVNALFVVSNPIPVKYALNRIGFPVGKPRLPLTEPDERSAAVIDSAVKKYLIDLPIAGRERKPSPVPGVS